MSEPARALGDEFRYSSELALLEQAHTAFGAAASLDEFYTITASLLLDENTFGFSRAMVLRYDDRTRTLSGKLAVGARSPEEHAGFRRDLAEEAARLKQQGEDAQLAALDPLAFQQINDLRYHSLWIKLLQGEEAGVGMNADFLRVKLPLEDLPPGHAALLAMQSKVALLVGNEARYDGLEEFISPPAVVGSLMTRLGLHAVILCDRAYEAAPMDAETVYRFQWLLNHAAVALANVELVSQLTETTQRLQDVDRLKTSFLSVVSHELRTPLTSIMGFIHLLADEKIGPVTSAQADLLQRVGQHANHLHSMVNDLLEIAEVEAGGLINSQSVPVDPLEALMNVLPKVEKRRGGRRTDVDRDLQPRPPLIRCDQTALERIFFHLLDNAAKFTPRDGEVKVLFHPRGRDLDIEIADTGIGISEQNQQRIFDHFYQVDSRLERVYGGMGIGMTVVKLLLQATGGAIRVQSTPGVGTCFTLTFPLADATVAPL